MEIPLFIKKKNGDTINTSVGEISNPNSEWPFNKDKPA
jgi:hypothetical protein